MKKFLDWLDQSEDEDDDEEGDEEESDSWININAFLLKISNFILIF